MIENKIVLLCSIVLTVWTRFLCTILVARSTHDIYVCATVINMHDVVYNLHILCMSSLIRFPIILVLVLHFVVNDCLSILVYVIFLGISWIVLVDDGLLLLRVICIIVCLVGFHVNLIV